MSTRKRWIGLVALFAGVTVVAAVAMPSVRHRFLRGMGHWLDVGVEPDPATAIMILNGDFNTRPLRAAQLFHAGVADQIIFAKDGSRLDPSPTTVPNDVLMTSMLLKCGVPESAIDVIDRVGLSTFDEANFAADWLADHPGATLVVVTHDYHSRRTRWVYRQCCPNERLQFASAPPDGYGPDMWWRHHEGFVLYLAEYLKFGLYIFLYGFGWVTLPLAILGWAFYRNGASAGKRRPGLVRG